MSDAWDLSEIEQIIGSSDSDSASDGAAQSTEAKDQGASGATGAPSASSTGLEDLPDEWKGRSVKELIAQNEALQKALLLSEQGRMMALQSRQETAPAAPPAQQEVPREKLAEMLASEDPHERLQAVEIMNQQAMARLAAQAQARFEQLTHSSIVAAEQEARRLYPTEFELFGNQIYDAISRLPDKSQLASLDSWRNLIAWVRGQDTNFSRYLEAKAKEAQAASAGFTAKPMQSATVEKEVEPDEVTKEIAKVFGWDPKEYAKALQQLARGGT